MSKGKKILIVVLLMFACSSAFTMAQTAHHAELSAFFAFCSLGLLIAIVVTALSRNDSRRR